MAGTSLNNYIENKILILYYRNKVVIENFMMVVGDSLKRGRNALNNYG